MAWLFAVLLAALWWSGRQWNRAYRDGRAHGYQLGWLDGVNDLNEIDRQDLHPEQRQRWVRHQRARRREQGEAALSPLQAETQRGHLRLVPR